jgi:hypothetical protein
MEFTTLSDVKPLYGSRQQAVFIYLFIFLPVVEGYCFICINCGFRSPASKEALAYLTDKKTKSVLVTMSYHTLHLAHTGQCYQLLLLSLQFTFKNKLTVVLILHAMKAYEGS